MAITTNPLLYEEEHLRATAERLLEATGILATLGELGQVTVGGAFGYRLMMNLDLDLEVRMATPVAGVRLAIMDWLKTCEFSQRIHMSDRIRWPSHIKPVGIWVGLDVPFKGRLWRIDVWFTKKESRPSRQSVSLAASTSKALPDLADDTRAVILALKKHVQLSYEGYCPSALIYKAVLERRITHPAAFDAYAQAARRALNTPGFYVVRRSDSPTAA
jgi:hypothetical protein